MDTGTDRFTPAALAVSFALPVLTPVTLFLSTRTSLLCAFQAQSVSVIRAPLLLTIITTGTASLVPTSTVIIFSPACTFQATLFRIFSDTLTFLVFSFLASVLLEPPQPNSWTQYMTLPTCTAPTPTRVYRLFSMFRRWPWPA